MMQLEQLKQFGSIHIHSSYNWQKWSASVKLNIDTGTLSIESDDFEVLEEAIDDMLSKVEKSGVTFYET